ncbi:MAG: VOC family protein [Gaiellaceae bacterium]
MSEQAQVQAPARTPFQYGGQVTVSVSVADLDSAIEWYGRAFGFELIYKLDDMGWCELSTPIPGVQIGLGTGGDGAKGGVAPYFTVADIEAARKHLESAGAKFDGDTNVIEGMVKLASFKDPDGNPFGLAESLGTPS